MKDRVAWKALKIGLLVMILIAALALILGCQPQSSRGPIVINGYAHCIPTPKQTLLCEITLEEQVSE